MKDVCVGASQLQDLFGIEWGCKRKLYYNKNKFKPDVPFIETPDMARGKNLEALAVKHFEEKNDIKTYIEDHTFTDPCGLNGRIDRYIEGGKKVLEVKCPRLYTFRRYIKEGLPGSYIMQMNAYLYLTKLDRGIWYVFCADSWEGVDFEVERDNEIIEIIKKKTAKFLKELEGDLPARLEVGDRRCNNCSFRETCWKGFEVSTPNFNKKDAKDLSDNPYFTEAVEEYLVADATIKAEKERLEVAKEKLQEIMKDDEMAFNKGRKITWKHQEESRWNFKKLHELPDKDDYRTTTIKRVFRIWE